MFRFDVKASSECTRMSASARLSERAWAANDEVLQDFREITTRESELLETCLASDVVLLLFS